MKVFAPGKLILSGEHAVLYNQSALAMAINRYVTATITQQTVPRILLDLSDLAHRSHLSFTTLKRIKERIKGKYHRFVQGEFSIREVLQKPVELAQFALSIFAEKWHLPLPHGVKIHIQSDIPIGCGLGSSAATVLSVIQAIAHYLRFTLSQDTLYQLALEAENMQHGHSSGLDLRVALEGGCLYVQEQAVHRRSLPHFPMYLINTGTPQTTTGECIEKVANYFSSTQLTDEFAATTVAMDTAIQQQSLNALQAAIQHNHRLLVTIGVVPQKVQQFITQIEMSHGAAKICGAGAVAGEQAGAVWAMSNDTQALSALCQRFGYTLIPLQGEARGVHITGQDAAC